MRLRPGVTAAPTTAAFATGERPGVTAAPTTAAFATGERPGLTAAPTTAALATGAWTTPTRPTRAALSGISCSRRLEGLVGPFGLRGLLALEGLVGLEGGDDRLDRDPPVRDELPARAARGGGERCGPQVLVDDHARDAPGLHRVGEVHHVIGREQLREFRLEFDEGAEVAGVRQLEGVDRPVLVLRQDDRVDEADRAGLDEVQQLLRDLAGEVRLPFGELDDEEVNGSEFVQ